MIYYEGTAQDTFTQVNLGNATNFMIINDSTTSDLELSFDGVSVQGKVKAGDPPLTFRDVCDFSKQILTLWVRNHTAGSATPFRVWAWR